MLIQIHCVDGNEDHDTCLLILDSNLFQMKGFFKLCIMSNTVYALISTNCTEYHSVKCTHC